MMRRVREENCHKYNNVVKIGRDAREIVACYFAKILSYGESSWQLQTQIGI